MLPAHGTGSAVADVACQKLEFEVKAKRNRIQKRPDDPPLGIQVVAEGEGMCRVECAGEVDIRSAALFGEKLCAALRLAARQLVLDLRGVTHMDSVGIGRVVDLSKQITPGARLQVLLSNPRLAVLLRIAGLGRFVSESAGKAAAAPGIR